MQVYVRELKGKPLDFVVARILGTVPADLNDSITPWPCYSTDWSVGGPVSRRLKIGIEYCNDCPSRTKAGDFVHATSLSSPYHGYAKGHDEPLIAVMRCLAASRHGESVEVPDELFDAIAA